MRAQVSQRVPQAECERAGRLPSLPRPRSPVRRVARASQEASLLVWAVSPLRVIAGLLNWENNRYIVQPLVQKADVWRFFTLCRSAKKWDLCYEVMSPL